MCSTPSLMYQLYASLGIKFENGVATMVPRARPSSGKGLPSLPGNPAPALTKVVAWGIFALSLVSDTYTRHIPSKISLSLSL